jgi:hypothetical protein
MDASIFPEKSQSTGPAALKKALGKNYDLWEEIKSYTNKILPGVTEEWNYSKYGWNYRLRDKKRVVIYLMPCDGYFRASFVFGEKATQAAIASNVSEEIKNTITAAKVYAEGCGFRIEVKNKKTAKDVEKLLDIKKQF